MNNNYAVSVIVGIYNPDFLKLKRTILSILLQKNINFEIILCDDGSSQKYWEKLEELFVEYNFQDFKIVEQEQNAGTVKNVYAGLCKSSGAYIYCISPGDYLYSTNTLANIINYASNLDAEIVFGDAVYYNFNNGKLNYLDDVEDSPMQVEAFDIHSSFEECASAFFLGYHNYLLGPTIVRKRDYAVKYFEKINGACKYVEDNTSTAFGFADQIRPFHYSEYVVWYEYGLGVSTSSSDKWKKLLKKDYDNCFSILRAYAKDNKLIYDMVSVIQMEPHQKIMFLLLSNFKLLIKFLEIKITPRKIRNSNSKMFDKVYIEYLYK